VSETQLTFGSLFAGIGGFDLGFERAGMTCKWQVEIDDYANRVLAKHWPNVHRERDIRTAGRHNLERVDVICGGFPCQDISYAGLGAGLDGERSGLFFEAIRVVRELRPRIVVLENVAALLTRGLDRVLGTLAEIGYDAEWHCIPAAAVGAPHIRDRVFVIGQRNEDSGRCREGIGKREECRSGGIREDVADAESERKSGGSRVTEEEGPRRRRALVSTGSGTDGRDQLGDNSTRSGKHTGHCIASGTEDVADTDESFSGEERIQWGWQFMRSGCDQTADSRAVLDSNWLVEPDVGRVANGVPARMDRLRGLGNAVVPQVAEWIGRRIVEAID
jgi:DNA (cytosine-5)-methyltransferase 1